MLIGQPKLLKEVNVDIIQDLIYRKGPISKPELARHTNLSLPTVNKLVDLLQESGLIKESGIIGNGVGRKAKVFTANESNGNVITLYFLDDYYIVTLSTILGKKVKSVKLPVNVKSKMSALESTYEAIDKMLNLSEVPVKAIGIGVPGVVKQDNTISSIPSILGWENINLKKIIEDKYQIDTFVENDVKLTTIGYYQVNLKGMYDNVVYIFIGKGLGSGIILNKTLYRGAQSFAGEYGYLAVGSEENKEKSYITKGGWLEEEIRVLLKEIQRSEENKDTLLKRYYELISMGIANYIAVLNPDAVIVQGQWIKESTIQLLQRIICRYIPQENIPKLIYNNSNEFGVSGIINMCISSSASRRYLVEKKNI